MRITNIFLWFFLYIPFIWFLENRPLFEQVVGFCSLFIGFITIFTPVKILEQKKLLYLSFAFYIGTVYVFISMSIV